MMLTITPADFRRLSESCQKELIGLLGFMGGTEEEDSDEEIPYEFPSERFTQGEPDFPVIELSDTSSTAKQVIDINFDQAKDLIANISEKSVSTLSKFTEGQSISLDELIGENRPYANLSDLKRSFVGAVNRRLRTVTGNRRAVLFLTVAPVSEDDATRISVRSSTANALKQALSN